MKAIILARVSDKKQDSNEAQVSRVSEYVRFKGLTPWKTYEIEESSTQGDRERFQEVVTVIQQSKEQLALVVDTVDRLQRSFKESVLLDDLRKAGMLEIHFYRENLVLNQNSNSADLLRWDMAVMFARSYVLQLSDNVKRKQEQMRRDGKWSGAAPFGYLNVAKDPVKRLRKDLMVDPVSAPIVLEIFEKYASGAYSVGKLVKELDMRGIRSKKGKRLYLNNIHHMLCNPFYYGEMQTKYGVYKHNYPPIVSRSLFMKVQEVLGSRKKNPFKTQTRREYIFRGLLKCGYCGCSITPELQKGNVYLSCTNAKGTCKREYVNEKKFLDIIKQDVFQKIALNDDQISQIVEDLKKSHQHEAKYTERKRTELNRVQEESQSQLDRLLDLLLAKSITPDVYDKKEKELRAKQHDTSLQLEDLVKADTSYHITAKTVLSLAQRAEQIFERSEVPEKRRLLNFILQNPTVKGKNVAFTLRSPFDTIVKVSSRPSLLRE